MRSYIDRYGQEIRIQDYYKKKGHKKKVVEPTVVDTGSTLFFSGGFMSVWARLSFKFSPYKDGRQVREFWSIGQAYEYCRAVYFNQVDYQGYLLHEAKTASDISLYKQLNPVVFNYDAWSKVAFAYLVHIVEAVAKQDSLYLHWLLGFSRERELKYAVTNKELGLGFSSDSEYLQIPTKWVGSNWYGLALERVRFKLRRDGSIYRYSVKF